ncbi:MAG: hypothetical protein L0Y66_08230, partial [Myxococcaceae bacterium]|nr:hypothetical protein [Myxococcaceae bacterium]
MRFGNLLTGGTVAALSALALGCGEGTAPMCELTVPTEYPAADYATNASAELELRTRFVAFTQVMKDAEADLTKRPSATEMKTLFEGGTTSLKSLTSSYYAEKVAALLTDFEQAAGNTWTPADPPTGNGGKYGSFIFSEVGTDLRQTVEKGMFGATFYNHALQLTSGTVTGATVDRLVAIFGAHPTFLGDSGSTNPNPDVYAAAYAERRTPVVDGKKQGLYTQIRDNLIKAHAAAARGEECQGNLEEALDGFYKDWERSNFATVIFYGNDVVTKLSNASATDADRAAALHGYGEMVGFIHGFRTLPAASRIITDAQIDELLTLLGAPSTGTVTAYKLVTDTAAQLPKLQQVMDRIQQIYGFSAEQ